MKITVSVIYTDINGKSKRIGIEDVTSIEEDLFNGNCLIFSKNGVIETLDKYKSDREKLSEEVLNEL